MNADFGTDQKLNGSFYQFTSIGTPRKDRRWLTTPQARSSQPSCRSTRQDRKQASPCLATTPSRREQLPVFLLLRVLNPGPTRDAPPGRTRGSGTPIATVCSGSPKRNRLPCFGGLLHASLTLGSHSSIITSLSPRPSQRLMTVKGDLTLFIACIRCDVWWVFKGGGPGISGGTGLWGE